MTQNHFARLVTLETLAQEDTTSMVLTVNRSWSAHGGLVAEYDKSSPSTTPTSPYKDVSSTTGAAPASVGESKAKPIPPPKPTFMLRPLPDANTAPVSTTRATSANDSARASPQRPAITPGRDLCRRCGQVAYAMESILAVGSNIAPSFISSQLP
ncbi:hypothetical protein OIO90_004410 [Microbotryomycetes sp. JL221]|nr:hypothetical protein OIO90_004410 [Microbotryomycetes sp. JL221]